MLRRLFRRVAGGGGAALTNSTKAAPAGTTVHPSPLSAADRVNRLRESGCTDEQIIRIAGDCYVGQGCEVDRELATGLWSVLSDEGNDDAAYASIHIVLSNYQHQEDSISSDDMVQAIQRLQSMCDREEPYIWAQYTLASLLANGVVVDGVDIVPQDQQQTLALLQHCHSNSIPGSALALGDVYNSMSMTDDAVHWYNVSVEEKDVNGMSVMATRYQQGDGVCVDEGKAVELFAQASELGSVLATYNVACCYFTGTGVEQNMEKAAELFTVAALGRVPLAMMNLAGMYDAGLGVKQDKDMAAKWWNTVAHDDTAPPDVRQQAKQLAIESNNGK